MRPGVVATLVWLFKAHDDEEKRVVRLLRTQSHVDDAYHAYLEQLNHAAMALATDAEIDAAMEAHEPVAFCDDAIGAIGDDAIGNDDSVSSPGPLAISVPIADCCFDATCPRAAT